MTHAPAKSPALPGADTSFTVPLAAPIVRANGVTIDTLTLRKPNAGELRGMKVPDLVNGDVDTLMVLIPRIASPTIGRHEAEALDLEDLGEIAGGVIGFFMSQTAREKMAQLTAG